MLLSVVSLIILTTSLQVYQKIDQTKAAYSVLTKIKKVDHISSKGLNTGWLSIRGQTLKLCCWSIKLSMVQDHSEFNMNLAALSGHLDLVCNQFPESEPEIEKLHSASMLHMSVRTPRKLRSAERPRLFKSRLQTHLFSTAL